MGMQVSIGTNMVESGPPWRMARKHLARLAEAGARLVDLHMGARYEAAGGVLRPTRYFVEFHNPQHWREMARWLDELGLTPVCSHTSAMDLVDISSTDEAVRGFVLAELRAMLPFCAFFKSPVMVVHPGGKLQPGEARAGRWDQMRRTVTALLPDLEKHGVRIALENLMTSLGAVVEELLAVVQELSHPLVGVCLDTGHLNVTKGRPEAAVRAIGPKLFALHVHDNNGLSDQHLPPGDGATDWTGFVSALKDVGYAGSLNLEVFDPKPLDGMASPDFIRRSLEAGRRLAS